MSYFDDAAQNKVKTLVDTLIHNKPYASELEYYQKFRKDFLEINNPDKLVSFLNQYENINNPLFKPLIALIKAYCNPEQQQLFDLHCLNRPIYDVNAPQEIIKERSTNNSMHFKKKVKFELNNFESVLAKAMRKAPREKRNDIKHASWLNYYAKKGEFYGFLRTLNSAHREKVDLNSLSAHDSHPQLTDKEQKIICSHLRSFIERVDLMLNQSTIPLDNKLARLVFQRAPNGQIEVKDEILSGIDSYFKTLLSPPGKQEKSMHAEQHQQTCQESLPQEPIHPAALHNHGEHHRKSGDSRGG